VEETFELRELSTMVLGTLISQEKARVGNLRANDALSLKHTAAGWHECLCALEMDWSPWSDDTERIRGEQRARLRELRDGGHEIDTAMLEELEELEEEEQGRAFYELSRHRDSRMRRMLLTKLPDTTDHSCEAYLDGKQRDQQLYEAGLTGLTGSYVGSPLQSPLPAIQMNLRGLAKSLATSKRKHRISGLAIVNSTPGSNNTLKTWSGDGGQSGDHEEEEEAEDEDDTSTIDEAAAEGVRGGERGGGGILEGIASAVFSSQGQAAGWEKRPQWTYCFHWMPDERMQSLCSARQVQLEHTISGKREKGRDTENE
jgi:hypothetical protein